MKVELKLKHLVPYLPYGLKLKGNTNGNIIPEMNTLFIEKGVLHLRKRFGSVEKHQWKPILRPLSDLNTKPYFDIQAEIWNRTDYDKETNTIDISNINYGIMLKLFEYHFDVFGLIEKGLAIDINTLEK